MLGAFRRAALCYADLLRAPELDAHRLPREGRHPQRNGQAHPLGALQVSEGRVMVQKLHVIGGRRIILAIWSQTTMGTHKVCTWALCLVVLTSRQDMKVGRC